MELLHRCDTCSSPQICLAPVSLSTSSVVMYSQCTFCILKGAYPFLEADHATDILVCIPFLVPVRLELMHPRKGDPVKSLVSCIDLAHGRSVGWYLQALTRSIAQYSSSSRKNIETRVHHLLVMMLLLFPPLLLPLFAARQTASRERRLWARARAMSFL